MQEADYFFVTYGNVTGSFVSHVYVMLLFYQAADCTTHGDYVIIGMRREYDDTFRIRFRTFGTIGIVRIRFTTRPSGDGMLQIVEDLDIHIICRTKQSQQFAQTIFIVILVCQFQDRLACQLAQPDDGATNQFVVPFAGSH